MGNSNIVTKTLQGLTAFFVKAIHCYGDVDAEVVENETCVPVLKQKKLVH